MRGWLRLTVLVLGALGMAASAASGCASGDTKQSSNALGGGGSGAGGKGPSGPGSGASGGGISTSAGGSRPDGGPSCADFTDEAKPLPAAMLIVLDASASMTLKENGVAKYQSANQALITAIDNDAFDNTAIGFLYFPDTKVCAPECYCDALVTNGMKTNCTNCTAAYKVSCGYPMMPQVLLADSGTMKSSDASGVRHDIAGKLPAPLDSSDDGSPDYEALQAAYAALKAYPGVDRRFAVLISDGGFSCTSLSNPMRPGYSDMANCSDWEEPDTVNALISGAYKDPTTPINTFIVGVPGSNTNGGVTGNPLTGYANAPYPMLLALSTYAVSGSPNTVNSNCDKNAVFAQGGQAPAVPCHIDLSNGAQFSAQALATAITKARNQALGCVYNLPDPPPGKHIDTNLVNVLFTLNGVESTIPRRGNASDMCTTSDCWDFNASNQVVLIGKACTDLTTAATAKIDIEVGCKTVIK